MYIVVSIVQYVYISLLKVYSYVCVEYSQILSVSKYISQLFFSTIKNVHIVMLSIFILICGI